MTRLDPTRQWRERSGADPDDLAGAFDEIRVRDRELDVEVRPAAAG